ncbi:LysM peptidoglycan-binding domain-containing protein [Leptolyngbya sp. AN02str]|uniref:LysM peptidoglycan-binding domain-containing protein n=1 Tax=Leptolyngbya sp. AN02str TaxID=3423363 RepID=UPI003D31EFAF
MERVAFLLEQTGDRLGCLLNPESLVRRRVAGVHTRRSLDGVLTGSARADDTLLYTGGGTTDLMLNLVFDVAIAGSSITTEDVRDLTEPLWNLAENRTGLDGYGQPSVVRFVWGKSWNIPGVIAAISERLETFTQAGVPRRSWVRMRFLRIQESPQKASSEPSGDQSAVYLRTVTNVSEQDTQVYEVVGPGDRPDAIAFRFYDNPFLWRLICLYNQIDDPLHLQPGQLIRVPPML